MAKKKETDLSTEEKIKEAARKVFSQKGYAATRTRDIAEEAGINLALLNYYFRSKEKLFELVIIEKMHQLLGNIGPILNRKDTTLIEKAELIAESYIHMLLENPDLPMFVLGEIRYHPEKFVSIIKQRANFLDTEFFRQIIEKKPELNPLQIFFSMLGMIIFPFIAQPVITLMTGASPEMFAKLMEERKTLIGKWMQAILETD